MQMRFKPTQNENVGYMFVITNREYYCPGQVIEGRIFFETFLPCFQTKLMLKLEGTETFPQHLTQTVFKDLLTGVAQRDNQAKIKKNGHMKRLETRILQKLQSKFRVTEDDLQTLVSLRRQENSSGERKFRQRPRREMNNAMKIIDDEESISSRMDEETAKWDRG